MSYMFYNCSSLLSLPDISNWNTSNVYDMSYMFYYCSSLSKLPDISKWNTDNVIAMDNMFEGCKSVSLILKIYSLFYKNVKYIFVWFYYRILLSDLMIVVLMFIWIKCVLLLLGID